MKHIVPYNLFEAKGNINYWSKDIVIFRDELGYKFYGISQEKGEYVTNIIRNSIWLEKLNKLSKVSFTTHYSQGLEMKVSKRVVNIDIKTHHFYYIYEVTALDKVFKYGESKNLDKCFKELYEYFKEQKEGKKEVQITDEELSRSPAMRDFHTIFGENIYTINKNGISFGKSLGARTRIDLTNDGKYAYVIISDGKITKTESLDTLEECLKSLFIYVLRKQMVTAFGIQRKEYEEYLLKLKEKGVDMKDLSCLININKQLRLLLKKVFTTEESRDILRELTDSGGVKILNDYIMKSGKEYYILNYVRNNSTELWDKLKVYHNGGENIDSAANMGEMGF